MSLYESDIRYHQKRCRETSEAGAIVVADTIAPVHFGANAKLPRVRAKGPVNSECEVPEGRWLLLK